MLKLASDPADEYIIMYNGKMITTSQYNCRLRTYARQNKKLAKLSHSIRRTVASELLESGMSEVAVQNQLGHSNPSTTRKYLFDYNNRSEKRREEVTNALKINNL